MNFSDLSFGVIVSLGAIIVIAAIGCIAALYSWTRITAEQKRIKYAEAKLISDDSWSDAYPHDKLKLAAWLRYNGIKTDSHLGDFIRTCWSAWLGGRPASLTELHVLVARRERSYRATRLSAGIAALLMICGIVGTLSAVKPVLEKFQLDVVKPVNSGQQAAAPSGAANEITEEEPDKEAALVTENADKVNKLIRNLGLAFYPSLLALLGTIVVVSCRGLYSLSLHRFTLDLDRFAVDTLIPRYRVPSLSEQYQEVKATLASVTENIYQREERFLGAVEQIEKLVAGISPALGALDAAATSAREATEALTSGATSISEALNRNLGAKSPIHRAVKGLDSVFEKTERSLENLSSIVEFIGKSNTNHQEEFGTAMQALGDSIEKIGKDHESRQSSAAKVLKDFTESLNQIPATIQATGEKAVGAGLAAVKAGIEELNGEQKKWHISSAVDLKAATTASLAGVTKAGQDLAAQAGRAATAASDIQSIKAEIGVALNDLTESGKSQISQIGDATKSELKIAVAKILVDAEKTGNIPELTEGNQHDTEVVTLPISGSDQMPNVAEPKVPDNASASDNASISISPDPSTDTVLEPIKIELTEEPSSEGIKIPNNEKLDTQTPEVTPPTIVEPIVEPDGNLSASSRQPTKNPFSRILKSFLGKNN